MADDKGPSCFCHLHRLPDEGGCRAGWSAVAVEFGHSALYPCSADECFRQHIRALEASAAAEPSGR